MFIGEYEHNIDAKGRVIMPSKLREEGIGEKFIVTKGLDGCLFAYSKTEWSNFEEKLKTLPLTNKNARDFVRFFLSGATESGSFPVGTLLQTEWLWFQEAGAWSPCPVATVACGTLSPSDAEVL